MPQDILGVKWAGTDFETKWSALEAGLLVTALDGLFWFGSQRIAADVLRLRKAGMPVVTTTVEVHDNLTGTTRKVPAYHL